ncbi:unnamed protein product [Mycena citricolor]|uniref:Retrotransposon Copia-like N-terminal domain-containing protein n=1 Tax=Mycena citricolor TaxID=2018698 RepID=A0AAD2H642_9AGAR|nr:unnamed protein product [Mycena citricolor]
MQLDENMTDNSAYRIKPLENAESYSSWSTKMINILMDQDLDDYVIGSKQTQPTVSSDTAGAVVMEGWKKKQRKALSAIRLRVGDGPMAYIQACTTGINAWVRLQRVYQPKGAISIIRLRRQLFRTTCEEEENIEEHI